MPATGSTPAARTAPRRLVLVPAAPGRSARPDALLRRYRLARLELEGPERLAHQRAVRFSHLKRCHD